VDDKTGGSSRKQKQKYKKNEELKLNERVNNIGSRVRLNERGWTMLEQMLNERGDDHGTTPNGESYGASYSGCGAAGTVKLK
jgi:hypothetical protein